MASDVDQVDFRPSAYRPGADVRVEIPDADLPAVARADGRAQGVRSGILKQTNKRKRQ